MQPHDSYTRLLGLALRGGNLVTGSDAVQSAVYAGKVRLLLLSADASPRTCRDAQQWSERGHCLCAVLPCDKAELGHALGSGTVAVAALTDTGLANAVGERLAQFDPERYAYLSERLQRKVIRAGERRAARARARPDELKARPGNAKTPTKARPGEAQKPTKARPNSTGKQKPLKPRSDNAKKPVKPRSGDTKARPRSSRPPLGGDVAARRQRGAKSDTPKQSTGTRHGAVKGQSLRRPRPKKTDT
ncbi:MAG: hypothetical protein IJR72_01460 [Oscillospiraceae bacterium]|nr:hypothetical protein [Oscillospiraceae bacterium]